MTKFLLEFYQKLKQLMVENNFSMKTNYARIGVDTDDDLLLNVSLKFPVLTIIIRCVFEESGKLYPQIYLDECLYES